MMPPLSRDRPSFFFADMHNPSQLGRVADALKLDLSLHQLVCGRQRKNIKLIESSTGTAIYFPSPFSQMYRYCAANAKRRDPTDIFITGESEQAIAMAKQKIHDTVSRTRIYMKDVTIPAAKIDSILFNRLDKIRKILEANGCYVLFPPIATGKTLVRVQGHEGLHVERTVREIMSLVCFHPSLPSLPSSDPLSVGRPVLQRLLVPARPRRPPDASSGPPAPQPRRHTHHAG